MHARSLGQYIGSYEDILIEISMMNSKEGADKGDIYFFDFYLTIYII